MISVKEIDSKHSPAARELWNASVPYDCMSAALFNEKVYDDRSVSRSLRLGAFENETLVGFAIGSRQSTSPGGGSLKLIAVSASFRRRGVGALLLDHIQDELRRYKCSSIRIGESTPNYLQPGIDARLDGTLKFARACGFVPFAETHNLEVDLERADLETGDREMDLSQEGLTITRASVCHNQIVEAFVEREFRGWLGEVARSFENDPISLHICLGKPEPGKTLSTVVAFSAYDTNNKGTGWFGPMGTSEQLRGKHIGEVLLKRCLLDLSRQGQRVATIPWVGPVEFYRSTVGARVSRRFIRMEKQFD